MTRPDKDSGHRVKGADPPATGTELRQPRPREFPGRSPDGLAEEARRRERLAKALRANLAKRKAQHSARARGAANDRPLAAKSRSKPRPNRA
jgi:hypothetical protein